MKSKSSKNLKGDYKATGGKTENFASAMERAMLYMSKDGQSRAMKDQYEYQPSAAIRSLDSEHAEDGNQFIDDLTWGNVHAPTHHNMTDRQKLAEKQNMSDELRRRDHKARKLRKHNEILARRAILTADQEPDYVAWLDQRDHRVVNWINALVISSYFQGMIMLAIVANTVVLALTWPQQDVSLKTALEEINVAFTFVFLLEAILKLVGLGPKAYFRDNWNKFDFIIVMVSLVELAASTGSEGGGSTISALRSMRLLRAFRLLGKFDNLRQLFMLVIESMHEVSVLTMVLGIFIFMFAALAMSLFGGKLVELGDARSGRWRFDNFPWAAYVPSCCALNTCTTLCLCVCACRVNVFMVISGDSWNEVMYDTVKATVCASRALWLGYKRQTADPPHRAAP